MIDLGFFLWGAAMAALVGYGGSAIVYKEYRWGIPSLVAGLALYAALWFTMP
jgi:hypothetical protein